MSTIHNAIEHEPPAIVYAENLSEVTELSIDVARLGIQSGNHFIHPLEL